VQVVHVLRDDVNGKMPLQLGKSDVGGVGLRGGGLGAALVVKIQHPLRVAFPCFGRAHVFDAVVRP